MNESYYPTRLTLPRESIDDNLAKTYTFEKNEKWTFYLKDATISETETSGSSTPTESSASTSSSSTTKPSTTESSTSTSSSSSTKPSSVTSSSNQPLTSKQPMVGSVKLSPDTLEAVEGEAGKFQVGQFKGIKLTGTFTEIDDNPIVEVKRKWAMAR